MRIKWVELLGKKYPMVFSNSAGAELAEEFGSLDKMRKEITAGNPFKAINSMLKILIRNGIKYCKLAMIDCPPELTFEPGDVVDMSDPETVKTIFSAINDGSEREVEVVEKNVVAKRGK